MQGRSAVAAVVRGAGEPQRVELGQRRPHRSARQPTEQQTETESDAGSASCQSAEAVPHEVQGEEAPQAAGRLRTEGAQEIRTREPPQEVEQGRSEEHTSELQSRLHLVCRL